MKIKSFRKNKKNLFTAQDFILGLEMILAEAKKPEHERDKNIGKKVGQMWTDIREGKFSNKVH